MSIVPARNANSAMGTPPRTGEPVLRLRHRSTERKSRRIFGSLGIERPDLLFALRGRGRVLVTGKLPQFLVEMLTAPPRTGEGVHSFLFRAARQLHAHLPATEIVDLLENCVANCGRHVPRGEIVSAVQNALACAWQPGNRSQPIQAAPKWPCVNQEQLTAIVRDGGGLVDLWEVSPIRLEDNAAHTEALIDALFPGNPLLCCGKNNSDFNTYSREEWRGKLAAQQLIVPSPMTARIGRTKKAKESAHALETTAARRFLVIEFDCGGVDEHAALLLYLAARAPLAIVVHSGNKSLHGWFYCAGQAEERLQRFMRYAVSLGADRTTWTRSQFVRMPDGLRDNGKRQAVYFFNPALIK